MGADKAPRGHYDAARYTRRTAGWHAHATGPNAEINADLPTLRNRHRDLARNNPWARRAINAIVNNTVGHGLIAQWPDDDRQARWSRWFETVAIDADGRTHGYGLQALILRTVVESGECLVRRRPRRLGDGYATPLQIHVLEPDHLDHTKNETRPNGNLIVQGVEFNGWGQRVAYWIFPRHPGESFIDPSAGLDSRRVPATEILHIYRAERPGQVRGVPWGTGAMLRLRMLDDYQDAQLERQRLAACFMGFRRLADPSLSDPSAEFALFDKLEPGAIEDLPPGVDLTFATPPQPENDREFRLAVLQAIGADYGVPYEILTGDLSEVNFSSARMGWNEFGRSIDVWRWQMLSPQLLIPLAKWFLEAEAIAGHPVPDPDERPLWTAPARTMVDPVREIPALQAAVRAGLLSLPQAIRQQGFDPVTLAIEHANYLQFLDSLGVHFDTDARTAVGVGQPVTDDDAKQANSAVNN